MCSWFKFLWTAVCSPPYPVYKEPGSVNSLLYIAMMKSGHDLPKYFSFSSFDGVFLDIGCQYGVLNPFSNTHREECSRLDCDFY